MGVVRSDEADDTGFIVYEVGGWWIGHLLGGREALGSNGMAWVG